MYTGWEKRSGAEQGNDYFGFYGTNSCTFYDREGTEYDQYRDVITVGFTPLFNIEYENDTKDLHDFSNPDMPNHIHSDKYMTSELRIRYLGIFEFGNTLVTGNPTGKNKEGTEYTEDEGKDYRAGILYLKIGPLKIGYDSETIRDMTQNALHRLIGDPIFPIKEDKKSHWVWEIEF